MRLFQLGNVIEDQVVSDLRACGFSVSQQQREVEFTQDNVKLRGHIDGVIEGLIEAPSRPHLLEIKSANKKKYDELIKLGSYRKWNEIYFWQTQFYMLDLGLKRTAVFVYCKDDSRLHMERYPLDKEATIERLQFVFESIRAKEAPERRCPRKDYFEAKFCPYYQECFK